MSRKTASLKVDLEIHKKIKWFRERKLITESISEFVNSALREKLEQVRHGEVDRVMREKLDEIIVEMGKMDLRLSKLKGKRKTHTPSRKTKKKK